VKGQVGLQATIPPQSLEGWYATIPPQLIKDGIVDPRQAYYLRCLGGPNPCPYTIPPAVLRYYARVVPGKTYALKATLAGSISMDVLVNLGFAVGNTVIIDPQTPVQEVRTIAAFGSMVFSTPLDFPHAVGAAVNVQAYKITDANLTSCPAGYQAIANASACQSAAGWWMISSFGYQYKGDGNLSTKPSGCYVLPADKEVWYNENSAGSATTSAALLCRFTEDSSGKVIDPNPDITPLTPPSKTEESSNIGAIVGGVVGGLLGLAMLLAGLYFCYRAKGN